MTDSARTQPQQHEEPVRLPVRRAANYPAFMFTGAVLGLLAGFVINALGPDSPNVLAGSATAYLLALGGLGGAGLGAIVGVLLEMAANRRG